MGRVDLASLASAEVAESAPRQRPPAPAGVTQLPIDRVTTNPLNQRTDADENQDELAAMAETIGQHGVLQPLVVVTATAFLRAYSDQEEALGDARWVSLIGNRRLTAARLAGRDKVPAIVNDDRLDSMFEVMLVENGHRRDLAPLREAEAMGRVLDSEDITRDELAKRIGRTGAYITQRMHLLGLIEPLRAALEVGALTVERGRELGRLPSSEQEAIAALGPPYRPAAVNAVKSRPRGRSLPTGNPAAAARSIRSVYQGDQLAELIDLLTKGDAG